MASIGDQLPEFEIVGVKPGFNHHEENGVSAFETLTVDRPSSRAISFMRTGASLRGFAFPSGIFPRSCHFSVNRVASSQALRPLSLRCPRNR